MFRTTLELDIVEVTQPVGTFYSTSIPAKRLLEICEFDFRRIRDNNGVKEFLGIQRPLKDDRVREIRRYIATEDASFPTSIVISVDERCASFSDRSGRRQLVLKPFEDQAGDEQPIPFRAIATIIDGQHRLKAFEGTDLNWLLSVNILVGADAGTQAMIFSKVNLAQTKVNKSLVYDLFSLDRNRSPEKTCHEITVNLNDIPSSPFYQRIKRLGSATDGVFGETLSQANIVKGILPYISNDPLGDRDIGRRSGQWPDRGAHEFTKRVFYPFFRANEDHKILAIVINFYAAVAERWPIAWNASGQGAVLPRTNGFNGTIRFLREAYLHLTTRPDVVTKQAFASVLKKSVLSDANFIVDEFPAGSSGSAALYRRLLETLS